MATEALHTSIYEGDRKNGRMEGHGKYTFPSGSVYTGQLLDGEFHGEGVLEYPGGCGKYHATWSRGKVVTGRYVFADGLEYTVPADGDWSYCRPDGDRRFYSELVTGLRPGGDSQLTNSHPPAKIPLGSFDTGDGYFKVEAAAFTHQVDTGVVYSYEGEELRTSDRMLTAALGATARHSSPPLPTAAGTAGCG